MNSPRWSDAELNGFAEAAQSLKLYRRAELLNEAGSKSIIEDLYVDPLPDQQVLTTILRPHTTFLIGRKGTGKSTIFQRAQHAIRQQKHTTSASIDIKTVYEQSEVDPALLSALNPSLPPPATSYLRKLFLFKAFAVHILSELRQELDRQIKTSLLTRARERLFPSSRELFEGLDDLLSSVAEAQFVTTTTGRHVTVKQTTEASTKRTDQGSAEVQLPNPSARGAVTLQLSEADLSGSELNYTDTLLRVFDIKQLIMELRTLLSKFKVHTLYLFIDDFSELPEDAMKFVVDTLIGPLNNWSNELVKFKVAAYPGRIYLGPIDRTKIDEIYIDMYKLYGHADVSSMESKAIEFTKRLTEGRLRYYCKCDAVTFFDESENSIWRILFYATMANPRNLGNILHYLHQFYLIYGNPVNIRAIADAGRRYYEEKIESYFALAKFSHETFDEKSSVFSLKELLEAIVARGRELRDYKESRISRQISGRTYSSHFHVLTKFEQILSTLEVNFFLTRYYEMKIEMAEMYPYFRLITVCALSTRSDMEDREGFGRQDCTS
jgi:hypothetical protein